MGFSDRVDRVKTDMDIVEHVLEGIHTDRPRRAAYIEVTDLNIRPWFAGSIISGVQVQVIDSHDRNS